MTKLKIASISVVVLLFTACVGSKEPSVELLGSYKEGTDKKAFCSKNIKEFDSVQSCENSLTVYKNSTDECKKSFNDPSCLLRNRNKWNYKVMMMTRSIKRISGEGFDQTSLDKHLSKEAQKFPITCMSKDKKIVACSDL